MPLVRKIFEATATPVTPGSDQEREVKALQKMYANLHRTTHQFNVNIFTRRYYALIRRIAGNNLASVLVSEVNLPCIVDIIKSILAGTESEDLRVCGFIPSLSLSLPVSLCLSLSLSLQVNNLHI